MELAQPQRDTIIFGFDSAWAGKQRGAICAITFNDQGDAGFIEPELVFFEEALAFIREKRHGFSLSLVAIDQPIIVINQGSLRPVERIAGPLMGHVGSGVHSTNLGNGAEPNLNNQAMFGDDSPIERFIRNLKAEKKSPEDAKSVPAGHFLIEVFPALALTGLNPNFAEQGGHPKYDPDNRNRKDKKFYIEDWQAVARTVAKTAKEMGISGLHSWATEQISLDPQKADQDKLDAALCALIGLIWRGGPEGDSTMIGDTKTGYMITPVIQKTSDWLDKATARKLKAQ